MYSTTGNFTIFGSPGSGKTTLLKHITLTMVTPRRELRQCQQLQVPRKIPILLFLRDHVSEILGSTDFTLIDALHDHLSKRGKSLPPTDWVKQQLEKKRCLVMLDGLDEVAAPKDREKVVDWVQKQKNAYGKNRFIVTSRPSSTYSFSVENVLEILPFTFEQIEQFVRNWYTVFETKEKSTAKINNRQSRNLNPDDLTVKKADALIKQIQQTHALRELSYNPLLLTMICMIHRYQNAGDLPKKRVPLYQKFLEVLLGERLKNERKSRIYFFT